ncbi:MAG TPA: S-adenosylmethionine:tRNA ribosyltransferase-isomerase [Acidimicrobiia bacterium]|nr:S-adenosylmethionine:tRNA ribosyltransferase-isomerase [Acidimicrobiia bacterium]
MSSSVLDFTLPADQQRGTPPEFGGGRREDVRLMVGRRSAQQVIDDLFVSLPSHLGEGDIVVINTSATLPAALAATTADGEQVVVHLSTPLPGGLWAVEVREPVGPGSRKRESVDPGSLHLPGGGAISLLAPHDTVPRLWLARLDYPGELDTFLQLYGSPIRYGYADTDWPLAAYQTVYAHDPGSAEMPSAGRPLTPDLITRMVAKGVAVLPIVLHAGVASLEDGEHPPAERFRVSEHTAAAANALKAGGGRLIAVGTTAVRALETVADRQGRLHPGEGYTELVIDHRRAPRAVDGLLTGWHEPRASHLHLIEAMAGRPLIETMYRRALDNGYTWHEFGDSCLILP